MKRLFPRHSRMPARLFIGIAGASTLTGCSRAPSISILGSFFPAWLICMVAGVALAAAVNRVLAALKLERLIVWGILVYPCLAALFAFTLWLVFFS